jgi:hypothetical protein
MSGAGSFRRRAGLLTSEPGQVAGASIRLKASQRPPPRERTVRTRPVFAVYGRFHSA